MRRTWPKWALATVGFLTAWLCEARELPPFKLGASYQTTATGFELMPRGNKSTRLTYRPAQSNYVGVIAGYRWLSGTVSFAIPASKEIRDREGESWYQDYRLTYYWRKFGFELSYNRYRGYVIENRGFARYNDLSSKGFGANVFYVFKPNPFSFPAALDQTDVQEKSGGSAILLGTFRQQKIGDFNPIIPAADQPSFGQDATLERWRTNSGAIGGGYAYYASLWSAFYLTGLASVTLGYEQTDYDLATTSDSQGAVAGNLHLRLSAGYNSRRTFVTFGAYLDRFSHYTHSVEIGNTIYGLTVAVGARFGG